VAAARMQVLLYKNTEGLSTPPRKLFENYFAVDLTVDFLLRFVRVVFVLGSSVIRNAKTAAVLHRGGKIFGDYFRQYRIILSADTASEVRQLLSQKRR